MIKSNRTDMELHKAKEMRARNNDDKYAEAKLYKMVTSILDQLTPETFKILVIQMQALPIQSETELKGVVDIVYERAIKEVKSTLPIANACRCLSVLKVPSETKPEEMVNFRAMLLTRCQRDFEKNESIGAMCVTKTDVIEKAEHGEKKEKQLKKELMHKVSKANERKLGNARFIGELFKLKMLTENIMHDCVYKLLCTKDPVNLECACTLLTVIGKELDVVKAKPRMDQYFQVMGKLAHEESISLRVRLMLQDVMDLRTIPQQRMPSPQYNPSGMPSNQPGYIHQIPPQQTPISYPQGYGSQPLFMGSQATSQRPPSTQGQGPPQYAKQKEKKHILRIVDPNSGKDVTAEILDTTQSSEVTGSSDSGSRSTPVGSTEEPQVSTGEGNDIAAQFAALVAAKLYHRPDGENSTTLTSQTPPPSVQQQQVPLAAQGAPPQNIASGGEISHPATTGPNPTQPVQELPAQIPTQQQPVQLDSATDSSKTNPSLSNGGPVPPPEVVKPSEVPPVVEAETVTNTDIASNAKKSLETSEHVTVSVISAPVVSERTNVSEEQSDSSSARDVTPEVNIVPPTPVEKKPDMEIPEKAEEPTKIEEPTAEVSVPKKQKSKSKKKDLNKKGEQIAGSEFDAYTDTTVVNSWVPRRLVKSPKTVKASKGEEKALLSEEVDGRQIGLPSKTDEFDRLKSKGVGESVLQTGPEGDNGGQSNLGLGQDNTSGITYRQLEKKETTYDPAIGVTGAQSVDDGHKERSRGRAEPEPHPSPVQPASTELKVLSDKDMEKKTKAILDEYFAVQDMKISSQARKQTGHILHDLVKQSVISVDNYIKGISDALEFAEDFEIDIPRIWQYYGELISPMVQDNSVLLSFLKQVAVPLIAKNKAGILLAEILRDTDHREGLKYTSGDNIFPTTQTTGLSLAEIEAKLHELIVKSRAENATVFAWIESNVDDPKTKRTKFIRALMTAVCTSAIKGQKGKERLEPREIRARYDLVQKYIDHQADFELQALYAVQALITKLEHPQGVLRRIFDTLCDEDIISENVFLQWEKSEEEPEGKDVCLNQTIQFFTWLRDAKEDN